MTFRRVAFLLAMLAGACSGDSPKSELAPGGLHVTFVDEACATGADGSADRAWLQSALTGWRLIETGVFKLEPPQQAPNYVLFDASCTLQSGDGQEWTASAHGGELALPDSGRLEPGVVSFSSADEAGRPFMVMSLPSVWRAQGVPDRGDMDGFLTAIFIHEMTHTRQARNLGARIDAIVPPGAADELSDDTIQHRFGDNPDFVAAVEGEIAELRRAADLDEANARKAAGNVLAGVGMRQHLWYADKPWLAEVEDVFLAMEGAGQYASYAWLTHPDGGGHTPGQAQEMLRTRWWTQEQGLALMILVARLVPDWRERVFGPEPQTATELLGAAVGETAASP